MFDRRKDRELILAKKPLIVLEDELWQINQLSKLRKDLRNRKKRLEKVIAVKRLALQAVQEKIAREVERKDGHDPLAIAGCMLAGAVQIYQAELGIETTQDLLDQIANGDDEDFDISIDKETIH